MLYLRMARVQSEITHPLFQTNIEPKSQLFSEKGLQGEHLASDCSYSSDENNLHGEFK